MPLRCLIAAGSTETISTDADTLYRMVEKRKKNGEPRICFDAFPLLKEVQGRIKGRILRQVHCPGYLTGGIPRRDYFEIIEVRKGCLFVLIGAPDAAKPFHQALQFFVTQLGAPFAHIDREHAPMFLGITGILDPV